MCYNGHIDNQKVEYISSKINSKGDGTMKFIISGKNITVSQGLRTAVEDKLGKLERYFTPDTEVIERQLRKYKNKIVDKQQAAANFQKEYIDKDYEEEDEVKIIRTKKFGIKPMYPEDACVQMELLGHNFFVFYNAETDQVNVVYKRKGNTYGLIEPEF